MAEQKQSLSIDEQQSIAEAILRIVASYDAFPKSVTDKKILLDDLKEADSIGIFPTGGAVVSKKFISGSFEAQFPFIIYFKCNPTTNAATVAKREFLEGLAKWMEEMEYPALTDGRKIQNIERKTPVTLAGKDESGNSIFQCGFSLKYFKKRS